jgi:transposase
LARQRPFAGLTTAEAICEAMTRPTMRFVPTKTEAQQAANAELKVRQLLVQQRTRTVNALRGHLTKFGFVAAKGMSKVSGLAAIVRDTDDRRLPTEAREARITLVEQVQVLEERIYQLETAMVRCSRNDETARQLATIPASVRSLPAPCRRWCLIQADSSRPGTLPLGWALLPVPI